MRTCTATLAAIAIAIISPQLQAQESPWEMRLLPAEEEWILSDAYAINNAGDAVGVYAEGRRDLLRGVLWRNGTWIDVGQTYGEPEGWQSTQATDINEAGLICGVATEKPLEYLDSGVVAILWDTVAGTWTNAHPAGIPYSLSSMYDLNDVGQAVGAVGQNLPEYVAFPYVWDLTAGSGSILPFPAGWDETTARQINNAGWIVGTASRGFTNDLESWENEAIVWRPDGSIISLHAEIVAARPEVHSSFGFRISEDGTVLGLARTEPVWWSETNKDWAWIWREGEGVTFLDDDGTRNPNPRLIRGRLVGGAIGTFGPESYEPAVYLDGILHRLPGIPGFGNVFCQSANDHNEIVGNAVNPGGWWWWEGSRAFIAVPRDTGDYDGDALEDKWELQGYDHDNGSHVDLPSMGANPLRRDLFVEIDAMAGHRPDAETLQPVIDAFKAHDIALHVHIDEDLPFDAELGTLDALERYQWEEFDALKSAHFAEELESAVRYCVFGHRLATLTDSGLARGEPSSDFIVSLGAFVEESGSTDPWMQAGTFMHELGHTLGLQHGGGDPTNRKPNYLSVMNYDFQKQGLRIGGQDGNFDYSPVLLAALNETALDESAGLGAPAAGFQTLYRIVTIDPLTFDEVVVAVWSGDAQGSIDWDGDTLIDAAPVSADINADGTKGDLTGHDDWAALDFNGGTVGFGVGLPTPEPPAETETVEELTVEEAKVIPPPPVEGLAARAGRRGVRLSWTPVGPYGQGTYRVYRWSGPDDRVLIKETQASLTSDNPGSGTWYYAVTVVDSVGAESLDSEALRVRVR